MTDLNIQNARHLIQLFDFKTLFIEELGWSYSSIRKTMIQIDGFEFEQFAIAELGGAVVLEIVSQNKQLPNAHLRVAIQREISQSYYENLLIFVDKRPQPTQSILYWVKQPTGVAREHYYCQGQSGDALISKLVHLLVDWSAS